MLKFPEIRYVYITGKKENIYAGEYCDYGAAVGHFGNNPHININLFVVRSSIFKYYVLCHEMFHFLNRPLPRWLERLLDISFDVTLGKHSNDMVFELYHIFNKEEVKEVEIIHSN